MKAGVYYGPRDVRYEDVEDLALTGDRFDVLIKVEAAGICGSDMHRYRANPSSPVVGNRVFGHELAGTVVQIGANVTDLKVGDRVGVEPLVTCGVCRFCRCGEYQICADLAHVGGKYSGGFAQYSKAPRKNLFKLPDHVPFDEASTLDCYSVAVHALRRVPVTIGDTVVVIGTGAIGICIAQVAKAAGAANVIIVGRRESALDVARNCGIATVFNSDTGDLTEFVMSRTGGMGADIVFEAVGNTASTLQQAIDALRPMGTVGVVANPNIAEINFRNMYRKELNIMFVQSFSAWGPRPEFEIALRMMAEGRINAKPMITHRLGLKDVSAGFEAMYDRNTSGACKVVLIPE